MAETIKYTSDGLFFTLMGSTGQQITEEQPVPDTGVAYLSTKSGPRVVVFPVYNLEGQKPAVNTIFTLTPVSTSVTGRCASLAAIEANVDVEDNEEDDELEGDEESEEGDEEEEEED